MSVTKDWSAALLRWYHIHKRDLPWRHSNDPYQIWISEIMLQQTRVETVKEYYRRFLERFPDVYALASAPQADVLKLWEGLGYYSRARNMQKAAQMVAHDRDGVFPNTAKALCALPGIGAYTAGAIASIAFGEATPAIDGNVKRVASRLFGIRDNVEKPTVRKQIELLLNEAIPAEDAGSFNQALMELGATLCSPRTPQCDACPLKHDCDACAEGDAENLPMLEKKAPAVTVDMGVCILTTGERALLYRRTERLLHGLYVFALLQDETDPQRACERLKEDGLTVRFEAELGEATHVFTHRIWKMRLYHFILEQSPTAEWLDAHHALLANAEQISALPLPTAMKAAKTVAFRLLYEKRANPNG